MEKGIFLCGYGCERWIWDDVIDGVNEEKNLVDWPKAMLSEFNKAEDFARWIDREEMTFDYIVGHSLGGLVALYYAYLNPKKIKKVILVESFIKSPSKFFQNIMMEKNCVHDRVMEMMKKEGRHYSKELRDSIRELDLSEIVKEIECPIYAIYGDRGERDNKKVVSELGLSEEIKGKIDIRIIEDVCHFPMLENSESTISVLKDIL